MSFIKEFRNFAVKGNVIDMAVGIIIGSAFGKIVSSLVSDIIMPPLGMLISGIDFKDFAIVLKTAQENTPATILNYGLFIQHVFDFLIIAMTIFIAIKFMNKLRAKDEIQKDEAQKAKVPALSKEEILLTEIRDLLKAQNNSKSST